MTFRVRPNRKIETRDRKGRPNGFLVPIYNVHDGFVPDERRPQQAYLTVVAPRSAKGPHLHERRWGLLTCIKGNVKIVLRTAEGYRELNSGEGHDFATIEVPAGTAMALVNDGDEDAYVLNLPSPAWTTEDPDDHAASFPDYEFPDR